MIHPNNLLPVLLVEDSPEDATLARRALARCGVRNPLLVVERGEDALELLAPASDLLDEALRPALILLDLNIPGMGGREVLRAIKSRTATSSVPVVILSTSAHPSDLASCYALGANAYHRKHADLEQYQDTMAAICQYWLSMVVPAPACACPTAAPTPNGSVTHATA